MKFAKVDKLVLIHKEFQVDQAPACYLLAGGSYACIPIKAGRLQHILPCTGGKGIDLILKSSMLPIEYL